MSAVSGSVSTIDRVHAVGERRLRRRVVVGALEPGLLAVERRLVRVGRRGELGGARGRLVERVAQRVGQHRDRAEVDLRRRGCP